MLRVGLRLLALAVLLLFIGFSSLSSGWFEVVRFVGVGCLMAGIGLLLLNHIRTPDQGRN